VSLAAAVGVAITFYLGLWQLSRAHQKEAAHASIETLSSQPPLSLAVALGRGGSGRLIDHRLEVTGRWLSAHTVALDNRPLSGKPGFFVFTPLLNEATGKAVMVQRGWVPRDFVDRSRVPAFATPTGEVTVLGRIARAPPRTFELGQAAPTALLRQNLNLPDFQRETRLDLWDHVLVQLDPSPVDGLSRDWPAPKLGTDTHYGYAFQWFGLCALIAALFVWFQLVPRFLRRATSATSAASAAPRAIISKVPVSSADPSV
jgi:surfeit locus 1 family protein